MRGLSFSVSGSTASMPLSLTTYITAPADTWGFRESSLRHAARAARAGGIRLAGRLACAGAHVPLRSPRLACLRLLAAITGYWVRLEWGTGAEGITYEATSKGEVGAQCDDCSGELETTAAAAGG